MRRVSRTYCELVYVFNYGHCGSWNFPSVTCGYVLLSLLHSNNIFLCNWLWNGTFAKPKILILQQKSGLSDVVEKSHFNIFPPQLISARHSGKPERHDQLPIWLIDSLAEDCGLFAATSRSSMNRLKGMTWWCWVCPEWDMQAFLVNKPQTSEGCVRS